MNEKIDGALMLVKTAFEHNKANATVLAGGLTASTLPLAEIDAYLSIGVKIITIAAGIPTIIVAWYNFKKMKKKDDHDL